eukprot:CAMPEP_0198560870 /NCGR_PEP_ID=MMETSP1462-20131121/94577_1 /TAXON_ID=1333877 /ORGANISM="Brandtodinium nutriculum, Strain RCC3387" /LENGTH=63 /DNA_ID=CAMNT_0044291745 /DNA_START=120 /DNA_END=311 /DNA_ORIENTATION=+
MFPILALQVVEVNLALHELVAGERARHHDAGGSGLGEHIPELGNDDNHREVIHSEVDFEPILL